MIRIAARVNSAVRFIFLILPLKVDVISSRSLTEHYISKKTAGKEFQIGKAKAWGIPIVCVTILRG
jgi:hypothetical protein